MSLIPIVGEAVVFVRIVSNRMAADIRQAVKDGLNDAGPDIDAEGQKVGQRITRSAAQSVKKDMEREVGKEVVLATRRLAITAGRDADRAGDDLGRRFIVSAGNGIRDSDSIIGRQLSSSMVRAISSNDFDRRGNDLGGNLAQMIGRGLEDNAAAEIGAPFRRSVVRELESGSRGALVRASDVDSNLFMRNFTQGLRNGEANLNDQLRRTFANTVRDQEADLTNGFRRVFVGGIRGAENDMRSEFRRVVDGSVGNGLGDAEPNLRSRFRSAGQRLNGALSNEFQRLGFFRFGEGWANDLRGAFNSIRARHLGRSLGEDTADDVDRGLRRRVGSNSRGLGGVFGKLGKEIGESFNLGIGAARMGQAAISGLILIAPSIISGLGAVLTALAGEIINFAAALGPGLAGAVGVGLAGVSTLALNLGLLKLAFSGNTAEAKAFKAQLNTFKETLTSTFAPEVLSGFSDLIAQLKDNLLPAIGPLLKQTGTAMGDIARSLGATLTNAGNLSRFQGILSTNITFLGNFKDGLNGLVTSFLILFNASKPFVDFIGEGIKRFGEWAAASLSVSEANGNLATWMQGMLQNFKDLWALLKDFGAGIANVFGAAGPAGEKLFTALQGIGERFRAWTSDSGNQDRMITFFDKAHTIASMVFDLLGKIFVAGGNAFTNIDTFKLQHFFDTLSGVGSSIASIFSQIKEGAGGNLSKIFDDIGTILDRAAGSGAVTQFAQAISSLALALADLLVQLTANPIGAQIAGMAVGFLLFGGVIKTLLSPILLLGKALGGLVFDGLVSGLAAVGAPVALVVAGIAALVGVFVAAYTQSQPLRDAISNLVDLVGGAFSTVWDKIGPKVEDLWGKFLKLAEAIGDRLAPVIQFLAPIIADAVRFIGELLGNILDMIGGFIDIITGILTGNWQLIWQGVVEILSAAWEQIKTVFAIALAFLSSVWDTITAVVYNAGQVLVGIVTSVWTGIWSVITTIASAIWSFLQAGWAFAVELIGTIFSGLIVAVEAIFTTLWTGVIVPIATGIWNFLTMIWGLITAGAAAAWDFITTLLTGYWTAITSIATAIWNGLVALIGAAWTAIQAAANFVWNVITGALQGYWTAIRTIATTMWNAIVTAITTVVNGLIGALQAIWSAITGGIQTAWDGLAGIVGGIWTGIRDAIVEPIHEAYTLITGWIADIVGVVEGVLATVGSAVTTVNANLQSLLDAQTTAAGVAANPVAAPGATFGGTSILGPQGIGGGIQRMLMQHLIDIPGLATGGIVPAIPGGTMFRLGEGGQRERVEPLAADGLSSRDRAMIKTIVGATVNMMSGGGVNVDVRIGENGLQNFVTQTVRRENSDLARRVGKVKR